MSCRVICISRSLGAGGEEIGRMVAKELAFRYADEEIIIKAAEKAGVSPETVAQAEHTPSLIARILESMARTPPTAEGWSGAAILPSNTTLDYGSLIEKVVRETANGGDVVIVAHGASIPLGDLSGVLRALVTASPAVRAERLAHESKLDEQAAKKAVDESDRQRREYLRRFHNVRQELPTHYDLVINTDVLAVPLVTRLIVSAARG
ncbi:MAG: cytidylate kinase-like family protein [Dehalococcoidia bacterium]